MRHAWIAVLALLIAGGTAAQAAPRTARIRCVSSAQRFERCPTPFTISGIALADFGPNENCVLGKTWGYDSQSVWVNGNCRGTFDVLEGPGVSMPVPPPAQDSDNTKRFTDELDVSYRQTRWKRLRCIGAYRLATYGNSDSEALCTWQVSRDEATITCYNPVRKRQNIQAFIECAK